jgi:hypothetical protein
LKEHELKLKGVGKVSLMSRTRGWLTLDGVNDFKRVAAHENVQTGERSPGLLKASIEGPSWMQTTKNFY